MQIYNHFSVYRQKSFQLLLKRTKNRLTPLPANTPKPSFWMKNV